MTAARMKKGSERQIARRPGIFRGLIWKGLDMIRTSCSFSLRQIVGLAVLPMLITTGVRADDKPPGRTPKEIEAEISASREEYHRKGEWDSMIAYNPKAAQQVLGANGPHYQKEADLFRELAAAAPKLAASANHVALVDDARLAFWGDNDAKARLQTASTDDTLSVEAGEAQQLIAWWNAFGDPEAQSTVVDAMAALAVKNPTSESLADDLVLMIQTNPASVPVGQKVTDVLLTKLSKTPISKKYAARPNKIDEPLDFAGTTLKNKSFKLKDLRGKVVMVDFWATWCPPCRKEIPHVAELYKQFHDQGFEIIGVSSDNVRNQLAGFLQDHPEMAWEELFQAGNGWHPLTKKFGIDGIPRMYLVDRNGNLRADVGDAKNLQDLIPKLLAEAYVPPAPAKTTPKPIPKPVSGT
jgi:thiol-disulfide isomerase/thioredoxin